MIMKPTQLLAVCLFMNCSAWGAAVPALKTQAFDRDPGWDGHNNHIAPKGVPKVVQDFGYSRTTFAGKEPGEIGGRVQRTAKAAFYAAKITPKTLNDRLSAAGTFAFTKMDSGCGVFFGFFNAKQPGGSGRPVASFGMNIGGETTGARLAVHAITAQNQVVGRFVTRYERYRTPEEHAIMRPTPIRKDGTRYRWKLDYDPGAGGGNGQFQVTVKSESGTPDPAFEGKIFTADLPAGFKQQGTIVDHFGLMNLLRAGGAATVHFDDLVLDGRALDFANDPGWDGVGNQAVYEDAEVGGAQNFGHLSTRHAGGAAGEMGGIVWRSPYAWYADRVGPLSLNDRLEARGRMFFESAGIDTGIRIGWFNSAVKEKDDKSPDKSGNFVGVDIGGHTRLGHWFLPECITAKGERHFDDKGNVLLKAGTAYEWSVVYDPAANAGNGQMRVTLGDASATLNLKPGAKSAGALLDRFGLSSVGTGGGQVKLYLDDLTYTATASAADAPKASAMQQPGMAKVVLLGDSVREGYAPFVAKLLAGRAAVVTPKANGRDTGTLLKNLDEWAIHEQPDVIHFNCGIHDTKRDQKTGLYNVPPDQYEANLRAIVKRLRSETKAQIVFALSTPLIDERSAQYWKTRSYRLDNASVLEYNRIALRVMKELGVPVNDLPSALGDAAEQARLQDSGGVHFTKEGSQKLAAAVAECAVRYLPATKK